MALAINFLLPVQRQMILILAHDHLRQQGRARQALLNQPGRQRRDDDPFDVRILGSDVQALPARLIEKGLPGAALLTQVIVSKYEDRCV